MRILAVDDDPILSDMLKGILGRAGYKDVMCCLTAEAALDYLDRGGRVDCFLLDVKMPGKDGITLCKEIRHKAEHCNTPIIMLTAVADRQSIQAAYAAGATEYVTKPFDGLELGFRIRTAVLLNETRTRANDWISAANQIALYAQDAKTALLGEARPYLGVPRALEFFQLENFLLRLDFGIYASHICSFSVEGLREYFERSDDLPYQQHIVASLMAKVAEAAGDNCLVSTAGDGVLVCVKFDRKPLKVSPILRELKAELLVTLDLSSELFDEGFEIQVVRDYQMQLLTGRQAADRLRASVSKCHEHKKCRSSESELRTLFQLAEKLPADGRGWPSLAGIIPRRMTFQNATTHI